MTTIVLHLDTEVFRPVVDPSSTPSDYDEFSAIGGSYSMCAEWLRMNRWIFYETHALEPLERDFMRDSGELPVTYPTAL